MNVSVRAVVSDWLNLRRAVSVTSLHSHTLSSLYALPLLCKFGCRYMNFPGLNLKLVLEFVQNVTVFNNCPIFN